MNRQSPPPSTPTRLLLLLVLALVAAAAVAAAPAAAAPEPTTLGVTAQSTSVAWGRTAVLNGALLTAAQPPKPVDKEQVRVEYSRSSLGPWTLAATVTNSAELYTSGAYTYDWVANRTYYWRMRFEGTTAYLGVTSKVLLVKVRAALGKPGCPTSVKAGKRFAVAGSLKPRFPKGSRTVTVRAQRYASGKWKPYKTYKATNADSGSYSRYSVKLRITKKGKFRFYATTAGTTTLAAGRSAFSRTLRVK